MNLTQPSTMEHQNIECKVAHILDLGSHSLVIGRITESYTSDNCLIEGKADISKIQPLAWVRQPSRQYHALGEVVAKSHSVGQELKRKVKPLKIAGG